jgi:replication fork protection complex subunit Csm3/Swi3
MDTDINDIWDLPAETTIRHLPADTPDGDGLGSTSPTRASNPPLFLPSDDEDGLAPARGAVPTTSAGPKGHENPDIDALFEGLDDMDDSVQELAPALDLDALRREADARNTRAVRAEMAAIVPTAELSAAASAKTNGRKGGGPLDGVDDEGDADDDGKKKRKPVAKLDEARLLGKNGFLQLIKDTKHFKPKGKGHEVIHLLFPILLSLFMYKLTRLPLLLRQRTWIVCSKCTNSGPTDCIPKLDSKRR